MPAFPIVDSHVHLYDVEKLSYGWLASVPKINRSFVPADFDAAIGDVEVDTIVFAEVAVDPGLHLQEAAWVQGLADADPRIKGMVAHAPVEKGEAVAADLEALSANRTLRGIRRLIQTEPDPSACLEPDFITGVKQVGKHGLPFDLCAKHWQLFAGVELVKRCPDVRFVLDHIGKPGIKHDVWEPWKSQIRELARLPNVVCKVSGVISEADHVHWSKVQVIPYVAHVIECFGFDRCMYGSDWTVSELTHAYPTWVDILDEVVVGSSDDELRQLYRETAISAYALDR